MIRVASDALDTQEWSCTRCSRRIRLRWPPRYQKVVLDRGDEHVPHSGGATGLRLNGDVISRPGDEDITWLADQGITWNPDQLD